MKRFEIGQIVVALEDSKEIMQQPFKKGSKYKIEDIGYCAKCGKQFINFTNLLPPRGSSKCKTCNNIQPNNGKTWSSSEYFALVDDITEELKEAVANEDYELAALLRDINK